MGTAAMSVYRLHLWKKNIAPPVVKDLYGLQSDQWKSRLKIKKRTITDDDGRLRRAIIYAHSRSSSLVN